MHIYANDNEISRYDGFEDKQSPNHCDELTIQLLKHLGCYIKHKEKRQVNTSVGKSRIYQFLQLVGFLTFQFLFAENLEGGSDVAGPARTKGLSYDLCGEV